MRDLGFGGGDDAAGDTVAGVSCRIGLHVVSLLVDHDGGSAVGEDAVGRGGIEGEVVDLEGGLTDVALTDHDVLWEVAGVVAHGVLDAVLFVFRIEVAACSLEVWSLAEGFGVDVDAVFADGQVFEVELDGELAFALLEGRGAGIFTGAGLERNDKSVFGLGDRRDCQKAKRECDEVIAHRLVLQSTTGSAYRMYCMVDVLVERCM
jgi:hypothetical protein